MMDFTLFNFISSMLLFIINFSIIHPFTVFFLVLFSLLLYKLINFNEIVRDYKEEIPKEIKLSHNPTLPPFYPNGWIPILESTSLKKNEIKSIFCFGQELIIARGSGNQVYVLDAYCPHLGANLAVGGIIERNCNEDCIRCPFHSWAFKMSDGNCIDVPYEKNVPKAKIKIWKSIEINNIIFVWYHANDEEPEWFPEKIEELINGKWSYKGRTQHSVYCHIQEIPENGADMAHLDHVHSTSIFMGSNIDVGNKHWFNKIIKHEWYAQWLPCSTPNQHMSNIEIINFNKMFGFNLFELKLTAKQIGPAYVEIRFRSFAGIEGLMLQLVTPIGPMKNIIINNIYSSNSIFSYLFGKFMVLAQAKMLDRDVYIWNRKVFLQKPYIGKREKSLIKFRRWFNQFYSDSSKINYDW